MTVYPPEVQSMIAQNLAQPLVVDLPREEFCCRNCLDLSHVYVRLRDAGGGSLHKTPSRRGDFWESQGKRSGWLHGSLQSYPCPMCAGGSSAERMRESCGLQGSDLAVRIDSFLPEPGKEQARAAALALQEADHQPAGFVTFWGTSGVGKSHLLKGLVNAFRERGIYTRYVLAVDLLTEIRQHYSQSDPQVTAQAALEGYHDLRVLCLDELDTIHLTNWSRETLFHLLDGRFNQRSLLLTALALHCAPDSLPAEWSYLKSRIKGGSLVPVGGVDMRLVRRNAS